MTTQTETDPGSPTVPVDESMTARAAAVADAVQRYIAGKPDLAVSVYGIAFDALTTKLRSDPGGLAELEPWLTLAVGIYNYVVAGEGSPAISELLAVE